MSAVHLLADERTINDEQLRACLDERDAYGQTVLHAAAGSRASGAARRAVVGGDSVARVGRAIGTMLPTYPRQPLTYQGLTKAMGTQDLALLLAAAVLSLLR